jgi:heme/copper-type cytochrome/quinol oxidase subunit 2
MNVGLMDPTGLEQTKAGKICGIIGTVFLILGTIFAVVYVIFAMVLVGAAATQGGLPQ